MRKYLTILLLFFPVIAANPQEFRSVFYNTENLFDTVDDTLKDDDEFLPDGARRWTHQRYWSKLDAISKVITAAGGWETPVLVGLCEIENLKVAYDLISRPLLINSSYRAILRESPDIRGIDVCLLYRSDMVRIETVKSWIPVPDSNKTFTSRNVLYVKSVIYGDTLHVFVCHWPSRRGGIMASENVRKDISVLLKSKIDSLFASGGTNQSVVIMGDFNSLPDDPDVRFLTANGMMVNLSENLFNEGKGSYRYQGRWEMIDQVIVSGAMASDSAAFKTTPGGFHVLYDSFLLEDDPGYPGQRPKSTFRGFAWSEGFSDHLPVVINIGHRK